MSTVLVTWCGVAQLEVAELTLTKQGLLLAMTGRPITTMIVIDCLMPGLGLCLGQWVQTKVGMTTVYSILSVLLNMSS